MRPYEVSLWVRLCGVLAAVNPAMEQRLGAHCTSSGVHFAVFSGHAESVRLCLFDHPAQRYESRQLELRRSAGGVWSRFVEGLEAGQLYGFRVEGPHAPQLGHRFNPAKLLVDPRARAITGEPRWHEALLGHDPHHGEDSYSSLDSAPYMPRSVVMGGTFDWQGVDRPRTPWRKTVIYECHVAGLTRLHPDVPENLRGTYLGLAQRAVVEHLKSLGVTAVELLPVQQVASEQHLQQRGLRNYWGYSTLGYFAPHAGYASGGLGQQVDEFRQMVRELHRAGLEVILDVVYNHTAEGDQRGPTLGLKGFDNRSYYRLRPNNRRRYVDHTGCGNTLDGSSGPVQDLICDSLRYWVEEMGVDGFRFDLATTLGRSGEGFDPASPLLRRISNDPVLAQVKLIAEPWDLGPEGYRLGQFPPLWGEWNDRFRDAARRFWRGETGAGVELARRLDGSRDLLPEGRKRPGRSVNFVTCHDGFTLADLVSYEHKRNQANGEENRDGSDHNLSRNWGHEGPSDDPAVRRARQLARRNLLTTLLLSSGVPMLSAGDELGHSQAGNNNAYCQDNELSWLSWQLDPAGRTGLDFVRLLGEVRSRWASLLEEPATWLRPDGRELTAADLEASDLGAFALSWSSRAPLEGLGPVVLMVNGYDRAVEFQLPSGRGQWRLLIDTSNPGFSDEKVEDTLVVHGPALALVAG